MFFYPGILVCSQISDTPYELVEKLAIVIKTMYPNLAINQIWLYGIQILHHASISLATNWKPNIEIWRFLLFFSLTSGD
jgi:hypothetical protein